MASSITSSLNGNVQVVDGVTNATIFLRTLAQSYSSTAGSVQGELVAASGTLTLPAATGAAFVYLKNLSVSNAMTVNLTFGTGSVQSVVIAPLGVALFASANSSVAGALITAISFPSASSVEYMISC